MSEETRWSDEVFGEIKKREIASVCTIPDGAAFVRRFRIALGIGTA